jgi:hypothetical protein
VGLGARDPYPKGDLHLLISCEVCKLSFAEVLSGNGSNSTTTNCQHVSRIIEAHWRVSWRLYIRDVCEKWAFVLEALLIFLQVVRGWVARNRAE